MNNLKLLCEEISPEVDYIVEGSGEEKKYFIEGIYIQTEKQNKNGRVYSKKVMEEAVNDYTNNFINTKRSVGELNHPSSPSVNLDKLSHIIESLSWQGNNVIGKARILTNQPMGRIVADLIDEKVNLGVSTRGLGKVITSRGTSYVNENYKLNAVDIVHDPSGQDCFVNGIFENYEFILRNDGSFEKTDLLNNNKMKFIEFMKTLRKR